MDLLLEILVLSTLGLTVLGLVLLSEEGGRAASYRVRWALALILLPGIAAVAYLLRRRCAERP